MEQKYDRCVRLCSDWCLREADEQSDYPQTPVSLQRPNTVDRYLCVAVYQTAFFRTLSIYNLNYYLVSVHCHLIYAQVL